VGSLIIIIIKSSRKYFLARFMFEKGLCFELFVNNFFFKKKVYVFGFQIFYQMRSYIYIYTHTYTHKFCGPTRTLIFEIYLRAFNGPIIFFFDRYKRHNLNT